MSKHVGKSTNYDSYVVITEYFDLANPVTKVDDIPDYEIYSQTIDSLNKRFWQSCFKRHRNRLHRF